jgi:hypothetical protein
MIRPRGSQAPPVAVERVEFVIDQTSSWIRSADTKASILAGFVGAQAALMVANASSILASLSDRFGGVALALGVTYLVAMVATATCLGSVIRPRIPRLGGGNPYSWPDTAAGSVPENAFERADLARAAGEQSRILAKVALAKYRRFGQAILLFSIMASSGFGLLVLTAL